MMKKAILFMLALMMTMGMQAQETISLPQPEVSKGLPVASAILNQAR